MGFNKISLSLRLISFSSAKPLTGLTPRAYQPSSLLGVLIPDESGKEFSSWEWLHAYMLSAFILIATWLPSYAPGGTTGAY